MLLPLGAAWLGRTALRARGLGLESPAVLGAA